MSDLLQKSMVFLKLFPTFMLRGEKKVVSIQCVDRNGESAKIIAKKCDNLQNQH